MLADSLTLCIFLSALATLRAAYAAPRAWFYLFKPLTTLLILGLALAVPAVWGPYRYGLAGGLVFSLAGDIFLMLSAKRFVYGLASFLLAHLCYLAVFTWRSGFREPAWLGLPFLALAAFGLWLFVPRARSLQWPVAIYGLVLLGMAWRAWALWLVAGNWLAGVGATLFVISDATLAVNRFGRRFHYAQVVVLGTYYAAQCLLAWSVHL